MNGATCPTSDTRQIIKNRYVQIRETLIARGGIVDHLPPIEEIPESEWDKDVAFVAEQRKGRSFAYSKLNTPDGPEETISLNTIEELMTLFRHLRSGTTVVEIRQANEEEIVDFILSGGIEFVAEANERFGSRP